MTTKKPHDFLQTNNNDLRYLFMKLKILNELNEKVLALLDNGLKKSCQVANVIGNTLILLVPNGSAATQLRFLIPDLLKQFKADPTLKKIQEIQLKVRPPQSSPKNPELEKMPPLSSETAKTIQDIAQSIEDPTLQEVLMRIAKHTMPQPK